MDGLERKDFDIDHVIPKSNGGKDTWGNTVCSCWNCNQRKADRSPHEAGMRLIREPKIPRVSYLVASGEIPEPWQAYLKLT